MDGTEIYSELSELMSSLKRNEDQANIIRFAMRATENIIGLTQRTSLQY